MGNLFNILIIVFACLSGILIIAFISSLFGNKVPPKIPDKNNSGRTEDYLPSVYLDVKEELEQIIQTLSNSMNKNRQQRYEEFRRKYQKDENWALLSFLETYFIFILDPDEENKSKCQESLIRLAVLDETIKDFLVFPDDSTLDTVHQPTLMSPKPILLREKPIAITEMPSVISEKFTEKFTDTVEPQSIHVDKSTNPLAKVPVSIEKSSVHTNNEVLIINPTGEKEDREYRIFISYSSKDRDLEKVFEKYLKDCLVNSNKYIWTDLSIDPGQDWFEEIDTALKQSNIGILLVSIRFLNSKFIMCHEFKHMVENRKDYGYKIIPVLLRKCSVQDIKKLGNIQFFKTYKSEYGITDLTEKDELMPFDELADVDKPSERLLNKYFLKISETIEKAIND